MALPMLVNGAECGPVNPLQGLAKRFDHDRGIQQDQFGANRAGPSRQTFRTAPLANPVLEQEAARFFARDGSQSSSSPIGTSQNVFDLSALRSAMPSIQLQRTPSTTMQMSSPQTPQAMVTSSWASDFLSQSTSTAIQNTNNAAHSANPALMQQPMAPLQGLQSMSSMPLITGSQYGARTMMSTPLQPQLRKFVSSPASWEKEFLAHDAIQSQNLDTQIQEAQQRSQARFDADELAKTAGLLIDTVKNEQNPKFKKSEFMKLMMGLRDGEIVVDGDCLVQRSEAQHENNVDLKGKGRAAVQNFHPPITTNSTEPAARLMQSVQPSRAQAQASARQGSEFAQEEDENLAYFQKDNDEYIKYWSERDADTHMQDRMDTTEVKIEPEWGEMQRSWDAYEATTWGVRAVPQYQFQPHNPYLHGDTSQKTQHHGMHAGQALYEQSVLELEAQVQMDPTDVSAWFNLGVRQQENERESKAILALTQAISLDPKHLPAWLALAISYTNELERDLAEEAINQWIRNNTKYESVVKEHIARFEALNGGGAENMTKQMKRDGMIRCLMTIAQMNASGGLDADIQIALAVLLNTGGDYIRAQDCFAAALSARPDDWQLYNRVGATLANSGASVRALPYYYRALQLNPTYIRARFNIGIACLNMARYNEAAQFILDALLMQDSDGSVHSDGGETRGITSSTLWDGLQTAALRLQRYDLANLCDKRDLDGFRREFYG